MQELVKEGHISISYSSMMDLGDDYGFVELYSDKGNSLGIFYAHLNVNSWDIYPTNDNDILSSPTAELVMDINATDDLLLGLLLNDLNNLLIDTSDIATSDIMKTKFVIRDKVTGKATFTFKATDSIRNKDGKSRIVFDFNDANTLKACAKLLTDNISYTGLRKVSNQGESCIVIPEKSFSTLEVGKSTKVSYVRYYYKDFEGCIEVYREGSTTGKRFNFHDIKPSVDSFFSFIDSDLANAQQFGYPKVSIANEVKSKVHKKEVFFNLLARKASKKSNVVVFLVDTVFGYEVFFCQLAATVIETNRSYYGMNLLGTVNVDFLLEGNNDVPTTSSLCAYSQEESLYHKNHSAKSKINYEKFYTEELIAVPRI